MPFSNRDLHRLRHFDRGSNNGTDRRATAFEFVYRLVACAPWLDSRFGATRRCVRDLAALRQRLSLIILVVTSVVEGGTDR